jgi:GNAT superfamily N-acetyltransferase
MLEFLCGLPRYGWQFDWQFEWIRPIPSYRREPRFLLYEIDVRPQHRNRGIGKALVKRLIRSASRWRLRGMG